MQNKSAIWLFTVLLSLSCLYQLSFSWVTSGVEEEALQEATFQLDSVLAVTPELDVTKQDSVKKHYEEKYLKRNASREVYPVLGYTYSECKEKEINLGLDLQGGMSVTLEVSIPELVVNLAANSKDEGFRTAMSEAVSRQQESQEDFITLFARTYDELVPEGKLAAVFHSRDNKTLFPREATNEEIVVVLRDEAKVAIDNTEKIIRTRIDKFGVAQPTIQKQQYSGRILIELPGVKDKSRVRKVLQSTANLEFWETYDNSKVSPILSEINNIVSTTLYPDAAKVLEKDSAAQTSTSNEEDELLDLLSEDSTASDSTTASNLENDLTTEQQRQLNPLYSVMSPAAYPDQATGQYKLMEGCVVGFASVADTSDVNRYLALKQVKGLIPADMRLLWGAKPSKEGVVSLYAIKVTTRDGKAPLDGSVIVDAAQDFNFKGEIEVVMQMNADGATSWAKMTAANIGKPVAIVLDNAIYSAPFVQSEIPNGRSTISMGSGSRGDQLNEAEDLANILKAGALPAPAKIVDESVVGPSLGQKNIDSGFMSFLIALAVILCYMVFYYRGAGVVSDIALVANLFFLIGALASIQASLTLPGIAGIVLTIGMSVDANVLIYERIREELAVGKSVKAAIQEGYKKAYAAIIDANLTTLLTAFVLAAFGSGPIKGFATTLIIGIFTSLFSAIFITRLIFTWRLERNKKITFSSKLTEGLFKNTNVNFVGNRKKFYVISAIVIVAGIASFANRGLNLGVDFTGGRTYTVKFDEVVPQDAVKSALGNVFIAEDGRKQSPEVKTFGAPNQVKITTNFMVEKNGQEVDAVVESKLHEGLRSLETDYSIEESRKVDPTISDDIEASAFLAIFFSLLVIFAYIIFRFRKWQYGLGALVAMFHDVVIVLSLFSIFYGVLPFSLEIDQSFIAAILTVVGYSINDTVVVFDRIREYLGIRKRDDMKDVINDALNSTLSRTVNTSVSTFVVLLTIFLLGGEGIQGFVFALMIGVIVGTYSSLYIASPLVMDLGAKNLEDPK
ncbi:MAG: SecD/SecF fusion protein [Flavobacteriales bacterium]|jgi:SecD/SecF fusion protein